TRPFLLAADHRVSRPRKTGLSHPDAIAPSNAGLLDEVEKPPVRVDHDGPRLVSPGKRHRSRLISGIENEVLLVPGGKSGTGSENRAGQPQDERSATEHDLPLER